MRFRVLAFVWIGALLASACAAPQAAASPASAEVSTVAATHAMPADQQPTVEYTLITGGGTGQLVFVGVGGTIDKQTNPLLTANPGDVVKITLVNGDGIQHDLAIDELSAQSGVVDQQGQIKTMVFQVNQEGEFVYYCTIPGHRQAGMFGTLRVGAPAAVAATGASVVRPPADLPASIGGRAATIVRVDLTAQEVIGQLADGTTYPYFTFNGKVPGPMIRVRLGDTIELHLNNDMASGFQHSIDLHAATGPGGGAVYSQTKPGEETIFSFKALNPGLYVYHCATPSVAHHIASGMYGLILVEPAGGLPKVDREFYVMQGEVYTAQPFGTQGAQEFSMPSMLDEAPAYYVFNGAAGALTQDEFALHAAVGDTVRIFFGVGGPNATSSFHVIGEIFDRVYPFASLSSPPLKDVQTITVPPGGASVVEFKVQIPGRYILVDHALSRLERGLAGFLYVEGEEDPTIFSGTATAGSGH